MSNNNIQLILGGARSGKSRLAESIVSSCNLPVYYIATAEANDPEMSKRIALHKTQRPDQWTILEQPYLLPETISELAKPDVCILVDCLTLWLSNYLCSEQHSLWSDRKAALLDALTFAKQRGAIVILVSNEVGHGIVPMGELSRTFIDESGWLHQEVARVADRVEFVMAGLSVTLKPQPQTEINV